MARNGRIEISFERERNTLRSLLSFFNRGHRVEHADDTSVVPVVDASKAERYLATLERRFGALPSNGTHIETDAVATLVLDASALAALDAGNVRARKYLAWAVKRKTRIVVPATALMDPGTANAGTAVADVVPIYGSTAEAAAELARQARVNLPIDALHVALAAKLRPSAVLTRDVAGLRALANANDQGGVVVWAL